MKHQILLFKHFVQCSRSFVHQRASSLVWDYRIIESRSCRLEVPLSPLVAEAAAAAAAAVSAILIAFLRYSVRFKDCFTS